MPCRSKVDRRAKTFPTTKPAMSESLTIYRLLKKDPRFPIEAYQFVREGLSYATEVLQMGKQTGGQIGDSTHATPKPADPGGQAVTDGSSALDASTTEFEKKIEELFQPDDLPEDHAGNAVTKSLQPMHPAHADAAFDLDEDESFESGSYDTEPEIVEGRHLTGQELCEALRQYALQQYGYMAKSVLEQWGITQTNDFGSIVYNMIDIGLMRKSPEDRREHFDDVYDFQEVFVEQFQFEALGRQ